MACRQSGKGQPGSTLEGVEERGLSEKQGGLVSVPEAIARGMLLERAADVVATVDDDPAAVVFDPFQRRWHVLILGIRSLSVGALATAADRGGRVAVHISAA